ncbi:unnamed protein product [Caenorhabditis auriculariae]|uniref:Peptidase S1 domain-containing protein n=1 Tax=Caenorhabditis auriculariae TaxID=2777116 RepID=A0A8S1HEU0_9PELO|nr:unnamed protein product [Caenorhabditis auriculariae]
MVDDFQDVVDKLCQVHANDVEKCTGILDILAFQDAKCGGRGNSAIWKMLKSLIAYDQPFKSYSEKLVLSADRMPSRPETPSFQALDVGPVSPKGPTSRKRQKIDPELEPLPVDGDLVSQIRQYAWFYTKGDNFKRSAIPITKDLAITYRHGENKNYLKGDSIKLSSYQNQKMVVDTCVVLVDEALDLIVLQTKSAELCERDLIKEAVEPHRGMKYTLMGYSVIHGGTSHISFSAGIISSDITSRLRFLGSSGSFKGDSGGSCWSEDGKLIGMQVETELVPHTKDNNGRPSSPASGGRCGIIPITNIHSIILKLLPQEEEVDWNE